MSVSCDDWCMALELEEYQYFNMYNTSQRTVVPVDSHELLCTKTQLGVCMCLAEHVMVCGACDGVFVGFRAGGE